MIRWLFLNARQRLYCAPKNPGCALWSLPRDSILGDEPFFGGITGSTARAGVSLKDDT